MAQRCLYVFCAIAMGFLSSCQRAQQYPAIEKKVDLKADAKYDDADQPPLEWSWIKPGKTQDVPILFVAESDAEWTILSRDWNHFPPFPTHFGLPPMQGLAAVVLAEHHRTIKIKVPRGLPDPTPHIPASNPPTLAKWKLGKTLFSTPLVTVGSKAYSCATCHDPRHDFAEDPNHPGGAKYNAPSLVNAVYNRRQFWDGRVQTLEETLLRSLGDEGRASPEKRRDKGLDEHIWGGFVRSLVEQGSLDKDFELAFGIPHPTQDAVARALATYLRTILSGDSLYDRADAVRRLQDENAITAGHFAVVLKDEITAASLRDSLQSDRPKRAEMPALLEKGYELFHGRARCARCHHGPLLTDHDFHNIGCEPKDERPKPGKETGRAVHVPIGMKQSRLIGAYRTPSLRNLAGTYPYFHNGSKRTLREVVDFYNSGVPPLVPNVAQTLKDSESPQALLLTPTEKEALVIFLRALQGRRSSEPGS